MIAPPARTRRAACWATTKVPRMFVRCIRSRSSRSSVDQRREQHDAGGVHDHVDTAEALLRRVEQRGDRRLVGDVALDRDRRAAGLLDRRHRLLGPWPSTRVVHTTVMPSPRQPLGDGAADPARAAGDDGHATCVCLAHGTLRFRVIGEPYGVAGALAIAVADRICVFPITGR